MSEDNPASEEQARPSQGPGDRLQSARISIGLTIEEVAGKMHLSTAILSSLEENNFDDITAPIFVKGYLRAYSRLVNENEEEIIQQYVQHYMDGDPPIASISNTSPEINADDARVKWVTWLIILLLIGLLALWWWNRYQQPTETVSLDSTEAIPGEIAQTRTDPAPDLAQSAAQALQQPETAVKAPVMTGAAENEVQAQNAASETPVQETEMSSSSQISQPVASLGGSVTETAPEPQSRAVTVPKEATATEAEPMQAETAAEPAENKGLQITVHADTWSSIKDADGKQLLKDLLRAGESFSLQGKPPITVFLGNGYGATLHYNGKKIDFSNKIKSNNTARIIVGQ